MPEKIWNDWPVNQERREAEARELSESRRMSSEVSQSDEEQDGIPEEGDVGFLRRFFRLFGTE